MPGTSKNIARVFIELLSIYPFIIVVLKLITHAVLLRLSNLGLGYRKTRDITAIDYERAIDLIKHSIDGDNNFLSIAINVINFS